MNEDVTMNIFASKVWLSLLPTVSITLFFLLSYLIYRIRYRKGEYPVFKEVEQRPASDILNRHFRTYYLWLISPIEKTIIRLQIYPNVITVISLIIAIVSGFLISIGEFSIGGWVYILSGTCDVFDGRVARRTGRMSAVGGILDSVIDRYSEFFVFLGLLWFYSHSWAVVMVMSAMFGSLMVSYIRAKSESLNIDCISGRFQRAERLVYLGVGIAVSPIISAFYQPLGAPPQWAAAFIVSIIAVGSNATAIKRFVETYRTLQTKNRIKGYKALQLLQTPCSISKEDEARLLKDADTTRHVTLGTVNNP